MLRKTLSVLLIFLLALVLCASASAATVTVRGVGEVLVPADSAVVVLGVSTMNEDAIEAQAQVNATMNAVRDALLGMGIPQENMATESVYLYPRYDYSDSGEDRIIGYSASNSIRLVTSDIDLLGSLIDTAFLAGANEMGSVEFIASNTKEAQERALQQAVRNAADKARAIAEASGLRLGTLVSIDEAGASGGDTSYEARGYGALETAADVGTVLSASQISVTSSIVALYTMEAMD